MARVDSFFRHVMPAPTHSNAAPEVPRPASTRARWLLAWFAVLLVLSLATGSVVALFLWSLDRITAVRLAQPALLWGLPLGGALVALAYARVGSGVERGNNLIIDEIHAPGGGVPARLAPLVLVGTLVTHLFGGSAGREGTAVQMGGALASGLDRHLLSRVRSIVPLSASHRATLLQAGIAAGFAAVFGTPLAGTLFALEVLRVGRLSAGALLPCLAAALMAHHVTLAWGIQHTAYPSVSARGDQTPLVLFGKVVVAALLFGLASRLFATATHTLTALLARRVHRAWLRPVLGGACVIALTLTLGTHDYLGLGVFNPDPRAVTLVGAFREGGADAWSWLLKGIFTTITIGSGFKGGEVTPLFFIGATLGNALAVLLHAPVALFAALGFVAVFAGATNTPIACTLMGLELFGIDAAAYIAAACAIAYLVSGPTGVYSAQRKRATVASPNAVTP